MGGDVTKEVVDVGLLSWGRVPRSAQRSRRVVWRDAPLPPPPTGGYLPRGLGRSYGDVCLVSGGELLLTRDLDRFIGWDPARGVLRCEAGVSLAEISAFAVPRGWFLPVTPGTRYVTVGGAIANDVHGKNHHRSGTFGRFVESFELRRTDGSVVTCSPSENTSLYGATIGGLGLTGLITWADIQLRRVPSPFIAVESLKFRGLDEFFAVSRESTGFEYTVAWLDCTSRGPNFCRGIFMRGDHAPVEQVGTRRLSRERNPLSIPCEAPGWILNRWSMAAFNSLYFHRRRTERWSEVVPYRPFFYPLDGVGGWNRLYGRRGFYQFQAVVPPGSEGAALGAIMRAVVAAGSASFLAVLKEFGTVPSPGFLSFPRPGTTICLDFPNNGARTVALLERLERMTYDVGGALYPAKDATMSPAMFRAAFPRWVEFAAAIDPGMRSDFWQRVTEG